jgi:pimeloyl-ACP methyl ester carboxylesterase
VPTPGSRTGRASACCYTVDLDLADLAADTVAFLDATGIQRATLVGHSGSCFTARPMAVTHPERVVGLAIEEAAFQSHQPRMAASRSAPAGKHFLGVLRVAIRGWCAS